MWQHRTKVDPREYILYISEDPCLGHGSKEEWMGEIGGTGVLFSAADFAQIGMIE
jgi:hypothetical protein